MARRGSPERYIEHLQALNRARKAREREEYRKNEVQLVREQNFQLQFSGANQQRPQGISPQAWTPLINRPTYGQIHRRKWSKPHTPLVFKQTNQDTMNKTRWNALKQVGQVVSKKSIDPYNLAARIEKLSGEQQSRVLEVLEQCESMINY